MLHLQLTCRTLRNDVSARVMVANWFRWCNCKLYL
jgi:hypothetical protein